MLISHVLGAIRPIADDMTADIDSIRKWNGGVLLYEDGKYQEAVEKFHQIREPSSKILFNVGCGFLGCGQLRNAVQAFQQCVEKDNHLAIGYFQCGFCYHKLQNYRDAAFNWNKALKLLQGKNVINYSPVRLIHQLYDCEIRHNLALTMLYLGDHAEANRVMREAVKLKTTPKHEMMITKAADACRDGLAFPLIEIPTSVIFRPEKALVANLSKKDYLGKAKVVASVDDSKEVGFSGRQLASDFENSSKPPYVSTPVGKQKGLQSRSLENLLSVNDGEKMKKKARSKSNEDILDDKKGTDICVSIQRDRLEYLKKNAPKNAPPRAPPPQRAPPKVVPKPSPSGGDVPVLAPPGKLGRQQAVKITQGGKPGVDESAKLASGAIQAQVGRERVLNAIPENEFDIKWKCLHDNLSRDRAWASKPHEKASTPGQKSPPERQNQNLGAPSSSTSATRGHSPQRPPDPPRKCSLDVFQTSSTSAARGQSPQRSPDPPRKPSRGVPQISSTSAARGQSPQRPPDPPRKPSQDVSQTSHPQTVPKQFSADTGMQWLTKKDQNTSGNMRPVQVLPVNFMAERIKLKPSGATSPSGALATSGVNKTSAR